MGFGIMSDEPKDAFDLIEFPCDYKFKAVCKTTEDLQSTLLAPVNVILGVENVPQAQLRASKNGKFTSVTFTANIVDREQLEQVYQALASSPHVVMTL